MDSGLTAWLKSHGETFTPDLSSPEQWFEQKTEKGKLWYVYKRYGSDILFTFGRFSTNEKHTYFPKGVDFNPNDPEYIELQELAEAKKAAGYEGARIKVLGILNSAGQNMLDPYLESKGFTETHPTLYQRINPDNTIDLLVPLHTIEGDVWGLQTIRQNRSKKFETGARVKGLMHCLNPKVESTERIYIGEGIATCLSILDILPQEARVFAALSSTNLETVAVSLREKYPGAHIFICADNDHLKPVNGGLKVAVAAALAVSGEVVYPPFDLLHTGSDWNDFVVLVGREEAKKEFQKQLDQPNSLQHLVETEYGKIIKPKKKRTKKAASTEPTENTPGDFGDEKPSESASHELPEILRSESGLSSGSIGAGALSVEAREEKVESRYLKPVAEKNNNYRDFVGPYVNGLVPLEFKGKKNMPNEQQVAHYVKEYYGENIQTSEEGELFSIHENKTHSNGESCAPENNQATHWRYAEDSDTKALKRQIMSAYNGEATSSKVESTLRIIKTLVPTLPKHASPWSPDPFKCNFANGTLHITYKPGAKPGETKYSFEFKEHNAKDFVFYTNPLEFDVTLSAKNTEFTDMVNRFFDKDPEADDKIRLLRQMYGACIAPIFPRIFMLLGPPGSGKSSVLIPAQRLVHQSNWCSVEPYQMHGFNLENMVGKLVNFVGDMHVTEPINDNIIKQIIDRMPFTVNRKYKPALQVPLPAIHIFAGNDAPPTFNRSNDVMDRRMSMLKMDIMKRTEEATFNFANEVFDRSPQGVLNGFGMVGLMDLLESGGKYHTFKSDRDMVREWQGLNDPINQFLIAIEEGDVPNIKVTGDRKDCLSRSVLWDKFQDWNTAANGGRSRIPKHKFTKALEDKGHLCRKHHGGIFAFEGLSLVEKGS